MAMGPDSVKLHVSMIGIGISYLAPRPGRAAKKKVHRRKPWRV
ncbi:hypothetical protein C7S16_4997 [Burkholderia thailandensis]|uniref:Uncharacterized protein n=1 Tax=Burkholderia thailandensis TaxID=57975 RepID=A0AAW9CNK7_BURTH|nr:hypothetical protein [Burkholderia thailandensis]MDW9251361.1 hypothetical protein [Burkholderia thailandensis]